MANSKKKFGRRGSTSGQIRKPPQGWALCRVLALAGACRFCCHACRSLRRTYSMEESRETYFVGEIITCGTPAGVHEIATLRPASLPAERMTALNFARSVLALRLSGFTVKEVKRSTLPALRLTMAFTSSAGALDLRPRFANSASFSGISSNSNLSEVILFPFGRNEFLTYA